jgi:DNA-binding HxlR family transcriptional regulator
LATPRHQPRRPPARRAPVPPASPLDEALRRVGDRWSLLVVEALLAGPRRFGELLAGLDGLAPNILSRRLKALEGDGLLTAAPYSQRPYRVAYALTAEGAELASALRLLAQWGAQHAVAGAAPLHHATCGTPVQARWWCPTCARQVDDDEAPDLDYV